MSWRFLRRRAGPSTRPTAVGTVIPSRSNVLRTEHRGDRFAVVEYAVGVLPLGSGRALQCLDEPEQRHGPIGVSNSEDGDLLRSIRDEDPLPTAHAGLGEIRVDLRAELPFP